MKPEKTDWGPQNIYMSQILERDLSWSESVLPLPRRKEIVAAVMTETADSLLYYTPPAVTILQHTNPRATILFLWGQIYLKRLIYP
jgi:hypothetical protein